MRTRSVQTRFLQMNVATRPARPGNPWAPHGPGLVFATCLIVFSVLSAAQAALQEPRSGLSDQERQEIVETVKVPYYSERMAEAFAAKYGERAVPFLLSLIEQKPLTVDRGHVYYCLGKIGDERAVDPMIRFIEAKSLPDPFERQDYHTYRSAMIGLGFIGNAKALERLRDYMTHEYWAQRGYLPSQGDFANEFGPGEAIPISALTGYALSLDPHALDDLRTGNNIPEALRPHIPGMFKLVDSLKSRLGKTAAPSTCPVVAD